MTRRHGLCWLAGHGNGGVEVYFTDRGIEEFEDRRGDEQLSVEWLAARMRAFVDQHPELEDAIERFATFLARDEADDPDVEE